jgi:hypothetical protein
VQTEGIETVKVYIRKGVDKGQRSISFIIPDWLSQGEILDRGWAIDGNSVLISVPIELLAGREQELIDLFRQKEAGITFC